MNARRFLSIVAVNPALFIPTVGLFEDQQAIRDREWDQSRAEKAVRKVIAIESRGQRRADNSWMTNAEEAVAAGQKWDLPILFYLRPKGFTIEGAME